MQISFWFYALLYKYNLEYGIGHRVLITRIKEKSDEVHDFLNFEIRISKSIQYCPVMAFFKIWLKKLLMKSITAGAKFESVT